MNKICFGCGAKLQTTDKNYKGYIPENKIDDAKYCMRCFRMMHYGDESTSLTPKEAKEIVNKINKDDKYVLFLVDLLNINDEVIKIFHSIKQSKTLIVNKCELLPKNVNPERIRDYLKSHYKVKCDIKLKGGRSSHGAKAILGYLSDKNIHEAYILGISNSGKSTLINDLIKVLDAKVAQINVNKKANTTLDFIRVNLSKNLQLIDSPGFILNTAIEHDVDSNVITAYSMNMKKNQQVALLDGKFFLKVSNNDTPFVFYTNTKSTKAIKKVYKEIEGLDTTIKIRQLNTDLVIKGIGFISFKKTCVITTNIDKKYIEIRPSMFGGKIYED